MTPRDLMNVFGDQFGITIPEDNPYLDEYYLNNQPLKQLWNNVENNTSLEEQTIIKTLEKGLWGKQDDFNTDPKEEPTDIQE